MNIIQGLYNFSGKVVDWSWIHLTPGRISFQKRINTILANWEKENKDNGYISAVSQVSEESTILASDGLCILRSGAKSVLHYIKENKYSLKILGKIERVVGASVGLVGLVFLKSSALDTYNAVKKGDNEGELLGSLQFTSDATLTLAGLCWAISDLGAYFNFSKAFIAQAENAIDPWFLISSIFGVVSSLYNIAILTSFANVASSNNAITAIRNWPLLKENTEKIAQELRRRGGEEAVELNKSQGPDDKKGLVNNVRNENSRLIAVECVKLFSAVAGTILSISSIMNPTSVYVYLGFALSGVITLSLDMYSSSKLQKLILG